MMEIMQDKRSDIFYNSKRIIKIYKDIPGNIIIKMTTQYFGGGSTTPVPPGQTKNVLTFLTAPNTPCTEAWILARGGVNNNGALRVRLVDAYGGGLSDFAELFNQTQLERVKLLNVNIPGDAFPPVVSVQCINGSSTPNSNGVCEGVLLVC